MRLYVVRPCTERTAPNGDPGASHGILLVLVPDLLIKFFWSL